MGDGGVGLLPQRWGDSGGGRLSSVSMETVGAERQQYSRWAHPDGWPRSQRNPRVKVGHGAPTPDSSHTPDSASPDPETRPTARVLGLRRSGAGWGRAAGEPSRVALPQAGAHGAQEEARESAGRGRRGAAVGARAVPAARVPAAHAAAGRLRAVRGPGAAGQHPAGRRGAAPARREPLLRHLRERARAALRQRHGAPGGAEPRGPGADPQPARRPGGAVPRARGRRARAAAGDGGARGAHGAAGAGAAALQGQCACAVGGPVRVRGAGGAGPGGGRKPGELGAC